jgi:hypothetical protein
MFFSTFEKNLRVTGFTMMPSTQRSSPARCAGRHDTDYGDRRLQPPDVYDELARAGLRCE